ncbi:MAG: SIMPL domain-containing protein [Actinomycetota bacterium]
MSEVTVTVRGEHRTRVAPERATIPITVRVDGPERSEVVERVTRLAEPVRSGIVARRGSGSIIEWSSTRLSVRAERPWNTEGRTVAPVYHASIAFTATFGDASELSIWVSEVSAWDGIELGGVAWHLTPETRARTEREVATQAVAVAVARAEAYAAALGLETVSPREIADVGLISAGDAQVPQMTAMRGSALASDVAPSMEYEPADIVVSAVVEARFHAY